MIIISNSDVVFDTKTMYYKYGVYLSTVSSNSKVYRKAIFLWGLNFYEDFEKNYRSTRAKYKIRNEKLLKNCDEGI